MATRMMASRSSRRLATALKTLQIDALIARGAPFSGPCFHSVGKETLPNSSTFAIPWASLIHSSSQNLASSVSAESALNDDIIFPREGPGLNYSLNWSLAKIGITPKSEAFKNLKLEELKEHGATLTESKSKLPFFTKDQIPLKQYSKLLKEARLHISSSEKVFVGEFSLGSAPKFDSKVKVVSDSPDPSLLFSSILSKTSSKKLLSEARVSTIYVASKFSSPELGKNGFSVLDLDSSSLILAGNSFTDPDFVKSVLVSLSHEIISSKGGLFLPAKYLIKDSPPSSVLVISSENVFSSAKSLDNSSVSKNVGSILTDIGVARLFENSNPKSPNLYKLPSSVVFLVSESTGAFPPLLKLSPSQAAYHFLSGYDGKGFDSFLSSFKIKSDLVSSALKLYEILSSKNIPSYVVNVKDGEKTLDEKEIEKLIFLTTSENIPKSKLKKPNDSSVQSLKEKFEEFVKQKYPELPAEIAI